MFLLLRFFSGDHYGDFVAAVSRRDDDRYIYFSTGCVFYFSHIFTKHTFNGYLRAHVLYIRTNVHGEKNTYNMSTNRIENRISFFSF